METKFRPNRRIFVLWRPFLVQNDHHRKPKWLPYGAAWLTPCKYTFPLKSVHFWIFNYLFNFYIDGHFEMAAILKILKTKSTTLSDDLLFGVNLTFFAPWLPWQRPPFWFFQPLKSCHTPVDIPTKFDERNRNNF